MIRPYGAGKLQGNIKLDTQYGAYLENSGSGSNKYTILDGAETPGSPKYIIMICKEKMLLEMDRINLSILSLKQNRKK